MSDTTEQIGAHVYCLLCGERVERDEPGEVCVCGSTPAE